MNEAIEEPKRKKSYLKRILLGLLIIVLVIIVGIAGAGLYIHQKYIQPFLSASHLTIADIRNKYTRAQEKKKEIPERVNILIVGLDQRDDEFEHTQLTDSIIFGSFHRKNGKFTMIPIPRDLWIDAYKTKINSLYYYGNQREDTNGLTFLRTEVSSIINQPIHYATVLEYHDLAELVDILGGVDVNIDQGFSDDKFPNPKYIESSNSGIPQYITVTFVKGKNHLTGEKALQFVRSRTSQNESQGDDLARSSRQVVLFNAIIAKLKNRETVFNTSLLGNLYRYWMDKIETNFTDEDVMAIALSDETNKNLEIKQVSIPATYKTDDGILINPPIRKYNQWVWEPKSGDWSDLQSFIQTSLQ